jgi:hypothetical protein
VPPTKASKTLTPSLIEALPRPWLVIEDANHHYNVRHAFYGLDDRMLAVTLVVFNAPDPSFLASRKFSIGD